MLQIWQQEPARLVGLVAALLVAAVIMWAPVAAPDKATLVAALVLIGHELVRSQVTPSGPGSPPTVPPGVVVA